jgi:hypothetical protein
MQICVSSATASILLFLLPLIGANVYKLSPTPTTKSYYEIHTIAAGRPYSLLKIAELNGEFSTEEMLAKENLTGNAEEKEERLYDDQAFEVKLGIP